MHMRTFTYTEYVAKYRILCCECLRHLSLVAVHLVQRQLLHTKSTTTPTNVNPCVPTRNWQTSSETIKSAVLPQHVI